MQALWIAKKARHLPESDREHFLDETCGDHVALKHEVSLLLARYEELKKKSSPPSQTLKYMRISTLGKGSMGIVYKALDVHSNRHVALKMMLAGPHAREERLAAFRRDAAAAECLHHRNIVRHYEVGEEEGLPWIAMELIEGESLKEKLQGSDDYIPPRQAAEVIEIIAHAIHYAHQKGIIHRDVKPSNILLAIPPAPPAANNAAPQSFTREEVPGPETTAPEPLGTSETLRLPMITDFGLAKRVDTQGAPGPKTERIGTPSYMAPEQAAGRETGPHADVYGLGATLYEMLTGRPPFLAETISDILRQVCDEDPVPPTLVQPTVPRPLETICLKCLEKDPRDRYATAAELAGDLRRWLTGEPIHARRKSIWTRLLRWAEDQPVKAGLTTALVTVLIVSVSGITLQWRDAVAAKQVAVQEAIKRREAELVSEGNEKRIAEVLATSLEHLRISPELKEHDLRELRQNLLKPYIDYYGQLIAQHPTEESLTYQRADAYLQLGYIIQQIGSRDDAIAQYHNARTILEELRRTQPHHDRYLNSLADCYNLLALAYYSNGKTAIAEKFLATTLSIRRGLIEHHPDNLRYRVDLARTHNNVGILYLKGKARKQAEEKFCAARDLLKSAAAILDRLISTPKEPEHISHLALFAVCTRELGKAYNNLGYLWLTYGDKDTVRQRERMAQAEEAFIASLDSWDQLPPDLRREPELNSERAKVYHNLGTLYQRTGRPAKALEAHTSALDILKNLVSLHGSVIDYRGRLVWESVTLGEWHLRKWQWLEAAHQYQQALASLGERPGVDPKGEYRYSAHVGLVLALNHLERPGEALSHCNEAQKYVDDSHRTEHEILRIYTLVCQGNKDAVGRAENVRQRLLGNSGASVTWACDNCFQLALVYSRMAKDFHEHTNACIEGAVEMLKAAEERGFFDKVSVGILEEEPDLKWIRDSPLFVELSKRLKSGH